MTKTKGDASWYPAWKTDHEGKELEDAAGQRIGVDIPSAVFEAELKAIQARRVYEQAKDKDVPLVSVAPSPSPELGLNGLSISGGGIRSATFSIGVMQALAGENVLKHMDYLSTVSGGGYSGSMLTWALYGDVYAHTPEKDRKADVVKFIESFGTGPGSFPIGTDDPAAPRSAPDRKQGGREEEDDGERDRRFYAYRLKLLNYLREHGMYLTPGGGITAWSALAVLARGILLNLVVWIGLVTSLILLTLRHFESWDTEVLGLPLPCILVTACALAIALCGAVLHKR